MPRLLYLGLDPSRYPFDGEIVHYPILRTLPISTLPESVETHWPQFTHLLFTSPRAVFHWFEKKGVEGKEVLAIGQGTKAELEKRGCRPHVAPLPTQEGVWVLIQALYAASRFSNPFFLLWPRSSGARPFLEKALQEAHLPCLSFDLYETVPKIAGPRPDLATIDSICFTSPSTVQAFLSIFGPIPKDKKIVPIGPVTQKALRAHL
jgi:uroporphyrinogen-III synthase